MTWYIRYTDWPCEVVTWLLAGSSTHALQRARQLAGYGVYVSTNSEPARCIIR
jgi:hypothetical protein